MSLRLLGHMRSLQARLLALLLGLVTVAWLVAATLTWYDTRHELDELLDGHLAQGAALLIVQQTQARGHDNDKVADAPTLHKYAPRVAFQVFHEGQLVMRSANAGNEALSRRTRGFDTVRRSDKTEWRVFAARNDASDIQIFVGEATETRNEILWAMMRGVLLPLVFTLPLLTLLLWWAVRQALTPLRQLSQALRERRPETGGPVVVPDLPSEIEPLVQALNALFERIGEMVASERRFTADAAHELRNPIAAIRAQAQVALGAGTDTAQRDHALQFTLAGCDRATRLVEQLLTLARLEAQPASDVARPGTCDVTALTRRIAADLAPTALARDQTLELDAPGPGRVTGDETLISVLVRNLIDNALRYSPPGAQILVAVTQEAGQTVLQVQDSGPGMSAEERLRLGERFYRVLGNDQPGSGLGWSIIRRIAKVLGARVQVSQSETLGGLAVSVRWPTPA